MRTPVFPRSAQRLGEFLVFLSSVPDEATAVQVAIERAASALEAEVAVLLGADGTACAVGFVADQVPLRELAEVVAGRQTRLAVPGAGECHVAVASLNRYGLGHLIIARSGQDEFSADEAGLLHGMARALELTLETLRTLDAERRQAAENNRLLASLQRRQLLLEQISDIQRAITRRAPHQDVLDSITVGAHRLLGADAVALWMRDPDDQGSLLLVSSWGLPGDLARRLWRTPLTSEEGPGRALLRDELVVAPAGGASWHGAELATEGIVAAMAAPVHETGAAVGSLEVASRWSGRNFTHGDQEILRVFAEHVSLAVTDARTHEAMRRAHHDQLTGLASRRLFTDQLDHALAASARGGPRVAVLFVDLDRFKVVNDSLGHAAGDLLLVGVADRLRACIRQSDVAARLGGDEFAVVLVGVTGEDQAIKVADRIIEAVRAPFTLGGKEAFVEASIGIAIDPGDGSSGHGLLSDADLAMYQAKRGGKGRYEVFRPELRQAFLSRVDLEGDLRHAVERSELVLHYQPVLDLDTLTVVGVEALLRWQHPCRGLIPPDEFIPLAEETGLIIELEEWVLDTACRQVEQWNRLRGTAPLSLSVNVSVRQAERADLVETVTRALAGAGLPADRLVLEITESLFLRGTGPVLHQFRQLDRLRVRLAVDDFGTGYSSMAYLRQFPVHMIKIDRSFVEGMAGDPFAKRLAGAVVQFGRALDLVVLAEGIEVDDQLTALREAGCQLGQGFYFARPLAPTEVEPLLGLGSPVIPCSRRG